MSPILLLHVLNNFSNFVTLKLYQSNGYLLSMGPCKKRLQFASLSFMVLDREDPIFNYRFFGRHRRICFLGLMQKVEEGFRRCVCDNYCTLLTTKYHITATVQYAAHTTVPQYN